MPIDWGLVFGVGSFILAPPAFGIGVAVAGHTVGEFGFARSCFIFASVATPLSFIWLTNEMAIGPARLGITAAIGAISAVALLYAWHWVDARQEHEIPTKPADQTASIGELLLECQLMALPEVGIPRESMLLMLSPFRFDKEGGIGFTHAPNEPGNPFKWPEDWKKKSNSSARCRVTNYGKTTLFNVELPVQMAFRRIKHGDSPGSFIANETINFASGSVPVTKIDPGNDNAYIFYIHNQGRDVVEAQFPDAATCLIPGKGRQNITVIQSSSMMQRYLTLWPVRGAAEIVEAAEKEAAEQTKAPQ